MPHAICRCDRTCSSWSLRGWLLFEAFGLKADTVIASLQGAHFAQTLADVAPARTVPALRLPEGIVISGSLALGEEPAMRNPEAGHWPKAPRARAMARALARAPAAEMHPSFTALRSRCPMTLRVSYETCEPPQAVLDDLARLQELWCWARRETGAKDPWLCGAYSVADAFFAPVAARVAGYNLPLAPEGAAYVAAHLADPAFRRWRAMGLVSGPHQSFYDRPWPQRAWPGPAPLSAEACEGPSVNDTCPYSGKPVTHFARIDGRVLGFCNEFCRDKSVADAEACPQLRPLLQP
ncbi:MAG: glutathione S-transferase family protein [Pararhodobacter sp.]